MGKGSMGMVPALIDSPQNRAVLTLLSLLILTKPITRCTQHLGVTATYLSLTSCGHMRHGREEGIAGTTALQRANGRFNGVAVAVGDGFVWCTGAERISGKLRMMMEEEDEGGGVDEGARE
jgi:hypothetical protein